MRELAFNYIFDPLVVTMYWASLVLVGAFILHLIRQKFKINFKIKGVGDNTALLVVLYFAVAVLVTGLFSVILYICKLPAYIYTIFYLLIFIASIVFYTQRLWAVRSKSRVVKLGGKKFLILILITSVIIGPLLADYIVSILFGTMFAGGVDAYVHLAKIIGLLNYGFGIDDSFYRGVVESRYHVNAIHPLYIPLTQIFHLIPAVSWNLSLAFFRLLQWLSLIGLAYFIARYWLDISKIRAWLLSAFVLLVCFAMPPLFMNVAVYPTKIVAIWVTLLVIGVSVAWMNKKLGLTLLLISSVLLCLTHPTYALMAALFVAMYVIIVFFIGLLKHQKLERLYIVSYVAIFLILMIAPLFTAMFPQHITTELTNIGSMPVMHLWGVELIKPQLPHGVVAWVLSLISCSGYLYLLVTMFRHRDWRLPMLVVILAGYYYLLVCNPVFMSLARGYLPPWLLERFTTMDILGPIMLPFGIYGIYVLFNHFIKIRPRWMKITITVFVCIAIMSFLVINIKITYKTFYETTQGINFGHYDLIKRISSDLKDTIKKGSFIIAPLDDNYHLPAAIPVKVLAIDSTHATPSSDSQNRVACQEELFSRKLDWDDLVNLGVDYVILPSWYRQDNINQLTIFDKQIDKFTFIKQTKDYIVYRINKLSMSTTTLDRSSPCYKYQVTEGTI